jgi:hypothetical protein
MNNYEAFESGLSLKFHSPLEKADTESCQGLKSVDFIVEDTNCLYLIEVKNYEQANAPELNRIQDYEMLTDKEKITKFLLEIGMKVKDTLLKRYAQEKPFAKDVMFLLIINFSRLQYNQRLKLLDRVRGYIPTGLNKKDYPAFTNISFDMPNFEKLKSEYGFDVTVAQDAD